MKKILLVLIVSLFLINMPGDKQNQSSINPIDYALSSLGYLFKYPGLGISRPLGSPYLESKTPENVYQNIQDYGGAEGTFYKDTSGQQLPSNLGGSNQYINTNYNNLSGAAPTNNTQQQQAQPTPERDWSNPANWGFDVDGMHFQTPQDYQNWLNAQNSGQGQGPSQQDLINAQQAEADKSASAAMDVLNQQEGYLKEQTPRQEQYITDQYGNLVSKAETQGQELESETAGKQTQFNQTVQNALQEATRAYNALKQQILARFGFGSSAGQGASDIATSEYYRTMGGNQQEQIRGTGEFAKEFGKIKTFVAQKKSDLDLWKEDSMNKLKADLADQLNQIATAKSTVIANKSYATMQVIQQAVAQAQAVAQQDKQFRQQIAIDSLNNMQQVAGRAFSPAEIQATLASFGLNVPGGSVASAAPTNIYKLAGARQDEFGNLINV